MTVNNSSVFSTPIKFHDLFFSVYHPFMESFLLFMQSLCMCHAKILNHSCVSWLAKSDWIKQSLTVMFTFYFVMFFMFSVIVYVTKIL